MCVCVCVSVNICVCVSERGVNPALVFVRADMTNETRNDPSSYSEKALSVYAPRVCVCMRGSEKRGSVEIKERQSTKDKYRLMFLQDT